MEAAMAQGCGLGPPVSSLEMRLHGEGSHGKLSQKKSDSRFESFTWRLRGDGMGGRQHAKDGPGSHSLLDLPRVASSLCVFTGA